MDFLTSILSHVPTGAELIAEAPIILTLILIDGLLSVHNALVLATMVRHLPEKQQKFALKAGLLGAYLFRGVALVFVGFLIANPWIKLVGGAYLIYLMCSHLGVAEEGEEGQEAVKSAAKGGLIATIISVELMDLAFSVDNVIAAVALSPKMWVVVLGVFIGILALRFVAGFFISVVNKFPVLEKVAYVLVGFIGVILFAEYFFDFHLSKMEKFATIMGIVGFGMAYEKIGFLQTVFGGVFTWMGQVMGNVAELVDSLMVPITYPAKKIGHAVAGCFKKS